MADKLDENYLRAYALVKKRLSQFVVPKTVADIYQKRVHGSFDTSDAVAFGMSVANVELTYKDWDESGEYGSITNTVIDWRDIPPEYCSTDTLITVIQDLIASNLQDEKGLRRSEYTGLSLQTLFLLDLQRYLARQTPPRIQRVIRAMHRRVAMTTSRGPLDRLQTKIEQELNVP